MNMAAYTVQGFRFESIVDARAFAVRVLARKSAGTHTPITAGDIIEGFVTKTADGFTYTSHRKTVQINLDGTLQRSASPVKPKASATKRTSQGIDIKKLEDDLMEFYRRHTDLEGPMEYRNATNLRRMVHDNLVEHPDPYHLWSLFAHPLMFMDYPKVSVPGFTKARLDRMLSDLRTLVHKYDKDEFNVKSVDRLYKELTGRS